MLSVNLLAGLRERGVDFEIVTSHADLDLPDWVEHVCDSENAAALADAGGWLLERPETAARFGRDGRCRALAVFAGVRYLNEYDELYRVVGACAS